MRFAALLALFCLLLAPALAPAPPGRKLVAFLERLGVGEYVELLAEDDVVDLATLRLLSMEQLRELGIRSMGHRARMVEAASRLTEEEMAEDEVVEEAEAAPEAAPKAAPEAEENTHEESEGSHREEGEEADNENRRGREEHVVVDTYVINN